MISKELLSEIYNFDVKEIIELGTDEVTYEVRFNGLKNGLKYNIINIYELANKCKEWSYKQSSHSTGYAIKTVHYGDSVVGGFSGIKESYIDNCKTEYELVFKLCQWILDNKDIK